LHLPSTKITLGLLFETVKGVAARVAVDGPSSKTALGGRDLVMAASENDITLVNAHAVLNRSFGPIR
jgi:hypothetical protein